MIGVNKWKNTTNLWQYTVAATLEILKLHYNNNKHALKVRIGNEYLKMSSKGFETLKKFWHLIINLNL